MKNPPAAKQDPNLLSSLQETVSASRLSLFLQCRLKFWFRYVLRLQKPKPAALHVGSAVHSALEIWNKARWRKVPVSLNELRELFLTAWKSDQAESVHWEDDEEKHRDSAWRLVETYLLESPLPWDQPPEAVEVPVEANMSAHGLPRLVGVLDLVQTGVIVDFKTSASTPTPEKAGHLNEVQTSVYATLYRETTGRVERGIAIHTLVKLKTPRLVVTDLPPMTDGQQRRLFRLIESYLKGVDREDWVPAPGLHCSVCEFFNECRSWQG